MRIPIVAIAITALFGVLAFPSFAPAQQKTVKACEEEWRANKAANQAKGITEKAYVEQCRSAAGAGQPSAAPAATAPARQPPAAATQAPAAPAPTVAPVRPAAATAPAGANEFSTEAQAKARCPGDTVVWANLSSKIYHFAGNKDYGTTKSGAYMCEKDTAAKGIRAAKNEKHP